MLLISNLVTLKKTRSLGLSRHPAVPFIDAGDSVSFCVYNSDFIFLAYHFPIVAVTKEANEAAETAGTYQPTVLRFEIQDQGFSCSQLCLTQKLLEIR